MEMSDHDRLIRIDTLLGNHLKHADMIIKIALTAAVVGAMNFCMGILLMLLRFGFIGVSP